MSATDWNTVTSDLQRAANNLAWFVLESMTVPGQPPSFISAMPLQSVVALPAVSNKTLNEDSSLVDPNSTHKPLPEKKRKMTKNPDESRRQNKMSVGKAVDRLISETLV